MIEMTQFIQFAATEASQDGGILAALGIDWILLGIQLVAFLLLVALLAKFVYPVFLRVIDEREAKINASVKAAEAAEAKAESAQDEVENLLATARKEAKDIVATARAEASAAVEAAEEKAISRAQKIVDGAHEQLEKDVIAAKKELHNQTIDLVADATQKILSGVIDTTVDKKLIASAIKEVQ